MVPGISIAWLQMLSSTLDTKSMSKPISKNTDGDI